MSASKKTPFAAPAPPKAKAMKAPAAVKVAKAMHGPHIVAPKPGVHAARVGRVKKRY